MSNDILVVTENGVASTVETESLGSVLVSPATAVVNTVETPAAPAVSVVVSTEEQSDVLITAVDGQSVIIESVSLGPQGIPGPQGNPGPTGGDALQYTAGEILSGHRMVVVVNGEVFYADHTNPVHTNIVLGMTTGAALLGATATVQVSGELTEPSWNWTLGTPVWLSTNGLLTQVVPTTGFSLIIGFPITTTKLLINIREPLVLV